MPKFNPFTTTYLSSWSFAICEIIIDAVGEKPKSDPNTNVKAVVCQGKIIMPGSSMLTRHVPMALLRGLAVI
jgi:cytosine/adenosine deaminase-related metal-dependent hydrolase